MKITFRGWRRTLKKHEHEVIPVRHKNGRYLMGEIEDPIVWNKATTAYGRVFKLALTGDFLVEFEFREGELSNWIRSYIAEDSEKAIRLLSEMQGEATIAMAKRASE